MSCHCTGTDFNCRQGRDCPSRYGYPSSRSYPRSLADAFPDVRRQFLERHVPLTLFQRLAIFLRRFRA